MVWRPAVVVLACLWLPAVASAQSLSKLLPRGSGSEAPPVRKAALEQSAYQRIPGTWTLRATLQTEPAASGLSKSLGGGDVANYLFLDMATEETYTLLPDHASRIVRLQTFSTVDIADVAPQEVAERRAPDRVLCHTAVVVAEDTDGDGRLTRGDRSGWGVAGADGRNFKILVPDLGRVFFEGLSGPGELLLIHGSPTDQRVVRVSLPHGRLISHRTASPRR